MKLRCQGHAKRGSLMVISQAINFMISTEMSYHHLGYSTENYCLAVKKIKQNKIVSETETFFI